MPNVNVWNFQLKWGDQWWKQDLNLGLLHSHHIKSICHLFKMLKLIENDKFNRLINILILTLHMCGQITHEIF